MAKITITLKEIELLKDTVSSRFAESKYPLFLLFIKEFHGLLKRKGVELDLAIEEPNTK